MQRSQEETKNELKEGMQKGLKDMQKIQEETKKELRNRMEKGLENVQKCQEDLRNPLEKKKIALKVEEKIAIVEERVAVVEEKIEKKVEQVEERIREQVEEKYEELAGNFRLISQRVEDLENKLLVSGNKNKSKILPSSPVPVSTSPMPVTASTVSVKLLTYDRKTNWETLTDTELLNLNSLYNALNLRFGQKFSKDYAHLQVKTRHQKPEESLQEYAFKMQKLTTLAFSDFSANVREMISFEYFVDGLKDEEIQMAVRMVDFKDLKSALLYAPKVEAATQASCIDHHSIREARVTKDEHCESRCIKEIEKLIEEMQALIAQRQSRRRRSITCWGVVNQGISEVTTPKTIRKIAAPSAGGAMEQDTKEITALE
ncbi:UNVERIFIED_CONTAM: hypothetical protein NCL1_12878 [Trichonephila clavipes]